MSKLALTKPTLILLYGYPGSGKTYFARQLCEEVTAAHVQGDRIRFELFEQPRYDKQENDIVRHLMEYMTEEFLHAGVSVVFDVNASRRGERRQLRAMARKHKVEPLLVWFQMDLETAFARLVKRDRRKSDDKYSAPLDRSSFDAMVGQMQNPDPSEDTIVLSGKHSFPSQRGAIIKKLYDAGLLSAGTTQSNMVKPGLVNLVPHQPTTAGRVDDARRNIIIR